MTHKIYALFVGIDNYHPESGVNSLNGCVNDINAIETYLRQRIATDSDRKWELVPRTLTNDSATRQAVIDGFLQHLCQADSEDVVLFYYAGHGAEETAPELFREKERNGKLETLVCYDSRISKGQDLADKELNYLIEQVAKNNPHILIILDSCHSGTATRDPEVVERQINPRQQRDLKYFLFPQEWLNYRFSDSYKPPIHIAFSACRDFQTAKEHTGSNGQHRGAFSYFLTEALQRTNGSLSYANLVQDINALITGKVKDQSPQIEATSDDLIKTFLGGAAGEPINYFTLSYDSNTHHNWIINGGILHGIHPTSEGETTIAIFHPGSTLEQLREIDKALCQATLTEVFTEVSLAEISGDTSQLSQDEPYWAIVTSVPLPKLKVNFQGDEGGVKLARTAISTVDAGNPSLFIRETESSTDADYYLEAINGQYWIKQPTDKKVLVAPIPEAPDTQGYTQQRANQIIKRLEHIARWKNILELKTPPTSQIKAGDVEMEVIVTNGDEQYSSKTETSALRGEYTWKDNKFEPPGLKIKVTNKSEQELYFQVIELAGSYAIEVPDFFPERNSISLSRGNVTEGEELEVEIPRTYLNNGITEYDTILKLIVSTREFNASLLQQPGLDSPPSVNRSRSSGLSGTLNLLMDKVYTRETKRKKDKYIDNWMTQEVKITLVKPPGGVKIKEFESTTLLTGVELQGHSSFQGKFSFNPLPPSSRDVNSNLIPAIFLQEQTILQRDGGRSLVEPYEFNMTRSLSSSKVLEIVDVQNHENVTPENPLRLLVGKPLSSDEHILPIAYDGEFFLPLGKAVTRNGKTEITLERLPKPTVNSRSLQGSIKILFQKLLYNTLGKNFTYPLLRIAKVSPQGNVSYQENEDIKAKVSSANKILLYIHGIIGDTKSLLPSVLAKTTENGQEKTLQDKYDLVLAFDYENINTTIQENAELLKQRLEAVGLTANHGKQLHIVAHSMGGLISRSFIEEKGGNLVVQHLVMLGTPNAGSPWPKIQDWAFTALGVGLNQLSSVAWPVNIMTALLAFLDAHDRALDQLQSQSDFIESIAKNIDPKIQYTIIAGDRSIRSSALQIEPGKNSSQIQRLMQKLFGSAVDSVVDKVFLQQPNDIAVTLESIKSISLERIPQPRIISPDTACDHLTYFTSQAGIEALVQALCNNS